jgi:hypothetical protein
MSVRFSRRARGGAAASATGAMVRVRRVGEGVSERCGSGEGGRAGRCGRRAPALVARAHGRGVAQREDERAGTPRRSVQAQSRGREGRGSRSARAGKRAHASARGASAPDRLRAQMHTARRRSRSGGRQRHRRETAAKTQTAGMQAADLPVFLRGEERGACGGTGPPARSAITRDLRAAKVALAHRPRSALPAESRRGILVPRVPARGAPRRGCPCLPTISTAATLINPLVC